MPGNFPVDEESSDLTFVFWYTLQVFKFLFHTTTTTTKKSLL